jgi:hypothetical protein
MKKPGALSCLLPAVLSPEGMDVPDPDKALGLPGKVPDLALAIIDALSGSKSIAVLLPSSEGPMLCGGNEDDGVTVCGTREDGVNGLGRFVMVGNRPDSPATTLAYEDRLNIECPVGIVGYVYGAPDRPALGVLLLFPLPLVLRCDPDPPCALFGLFGLFGLFDMFAAKSQKV